MAIELRNRLHSQFGGEFTINATAVFDYPTIGGLAEYLVGQLPDVGVAPEAAAERQAPIPAAGVLIGPARRFHLGGQRRLQRHVEPVVDARLLRRPASRARRAAGWRRWCCRRRRGCRRARRRG